MNLRKKLLLIYCWLFVATSASYGQSYFLDFNTLSHQTVDGDAGTSDSASFLADVDIAGVRGVPATSKAYNSITLAAPGQSPQSLTNNPDDLMSWSEGANFASVMDLDEAYPSGTYTFQTSGGLGGSSTLNVDDAITFPSSAFFTGTSLEDLASDNPDAPIVVTFNNPLLNQPSNSDSALELEIFLPTTDSGNDYFLSNSATEFTIPANRIVPGEPCDIALYIDNGAIKGGGSGTPYTSIDYESTTEVSFIAAPVPETSSVAYAAFGFVTLAAARRVWRRA